MLKVGVDIGTKAYEQLRKRGQAILTFKVRRHPKDESFRPESHTIALYVIPLDDERGELLPDELPEECFEGMISAVDEEPRVCTVEVESLYGRFDRWFNKKPKRESKAVWIVAEPTKGLKDKYERTAFKRSFKAGKVFPLIVSLEPKPRSMAQLKV